MSGPGSARSKGLADSYSGVALPTSRLDPKEVAGSGFRYQKVFGEDQFIAAGVVYIPVGGSKPGKHSKDNSYVRGRDEV